MSKLIEVDKDNLYAAYCDVRSALQRLELLMAGIGCIHVNAINKTTFADKAKGQRKLYCPDCKTEIISEEV
jgi:hypothetical protein